MKLPLLWSNAALADMLSIFELIMEGSPQNALLVDDRVNEQVELLADFPLVGKDGRTPGTRELVINKASCVVMYRVEEDAIRIVRVVYRGQQRPDELSF